MNIAARTARRWKARRDVPTSKQGIAATGNFGALWPLWAGWKIEGAQLIDPQGQSLSLGELRAYQLKLQLLADFERRERERRQLDLF